MDAVSSPPHYNKGKIEVVEFIEDQKLGYHLGNAIKYICRAGSKDPEKLAEDLHKACWYILRHVEIHNAERFGRDPIRPNEMKNPASKKSHSVEFDCEWKDALKILPLEKRDEEVVLSIPKHVATHVTVEIMK